MCNQNQCNMCTTGYKVNNPTSTDACSADTDCNNEDFMTVGNTCVTRKNMGDLSNAVPNQIPDDVVTVVSSGSSCTNNKCCWRGATSTTNCDASNGDYSGCNRTVCTYGAAKEICDNFKYGGKIWRLPEGSEAVNWMKNNTKSLKNH